MVSKSEAVPLGTPPPPVSDAKSEKILLARVNNEEKLRNISSAVSSTKEEDAYCAYFSTTS
jgi:hypothetical protein